MFKGFWPRRLRTQLILGIAMVHLLLMSVFVADMVVRQDNFLRTQSKQQALSLANDLAVNADAHVLGNDFDGLERVVQNYQNFPHLKYAMVISPDNEVLSHTNLSYVGKKMLDSISLRIGKVAGSHILFGDDQVIDAVAPVMQGNTVIAWARVAISQDYISADVSAILRKGIFYVLIAIVLGTLVAIGIGNRLTKGLYKLIFAADTIKAGDRSVRAADSGSLEIGRLATAFNQMLNEIVSNESTLKNAFNYSASGMAISDLNGQWTRVNDTFCSMLGYSTEELLRMNFKDVTYPEDLEDTLGKFGLLQRGEIDKYSIEKRFLHRTGRIVWVHITVSAVKDQHGRPMFLVAQVDDVTESVLTSQEIKRRQSIQESIFQNADGSISLVDKDLRYVIFNRQHAEDHHRLTGRYPVVGEVLYGDFPQEMMEKRHALLRHVLRGNKEVVDGEYVLDGRRTYYHTSFNPVRVDGQVIGFTTYSINLTARKEAELEILKLNRLYLFISKINESILRLESREEIYAEACRIAIQYGRFRMAWFGLYDQLNDRIEPVKCEGAEDGLIDAIGIRNMKMSTSMIPAARAIRNRSYFCYNDIANAPELGPIQAEMLKRDYRSCISFPVMVDNEIIGAIVLFMNEPDFFNDTEIKLLREVTENVAQALDKIRIKELRERTAAELKESEEKFRTLVEQSQVGVYILQDSQFVYINPLLERISGYTATELIKKQSFDPIVHQEDREFARQKYEDRISGKVMTDDFVLRIIKKNGAIAHLQIIVSRIIYRNRPAALGSVIDITDRLHEDKRINKAVIAAQEKERIQMGMELHDNVQQIIAGAKLTVDYAISCYDDKKEATSALGDVKRYLNDGITELRRLSHQLAPSIRFEQNLEDKIRALVETMNVGRSAEVKLEVDPLGQPISQEIQLAFYRILQEQLTNILKYAHASVINIRLKESADRIVLAIRDNGRGFDPEKKKTGIGFENIRRRVAALEGDLKIKSSPGNGCELLLQVPVGS